MQSATGKTRVQVLTGDPEFEQLVRTTFDAGGAKIDLVVAGAVGARGVGHARRLPRPLPLSTSTRRIPMNSTPCSRS